MAAVPEHRSKLYFPYVIPRFAYTDAKFQVHPLILKKILMFRFYQISLSKHLRFNFHFHKDDEFVRVI